MEKIIKHTDLDVTKLQYSNPRKLGSIYYSDISYNNSPLFIQTTKLNNLTNTSNLDFSKPSELKLSVDDDIYTLFNRLDENNVNTIEKNSYEWFSKQLRLEDSENMYRNITNSIRNNEKPNIKFKLPILNGKLLSKIYNQEKIDIDIKDIAKDQECILIVHIRGIKFFKSYYICDYYITHIKTYTKLNYNIPENCIIETVDNDNKYDYEILDEEVLNKNKKDINLTEDKIKMLEKELLNLKKKRENLLV